MIAPLWQNRNLSLLYHIWAGNFLIAKHAKPGEPRSSHLPNREWTRMGANWNAAFTGNGVNGGGRGGVRVRQTGQADKQRECHFSGIPSLGRRGEAVLSGETMNLRKYSGPVLDFVARGPKRRHDQVYSLACVIAFSAQISYDLFKLLIRKGPR
jgi:hypothetical protein